MPTCNGTPFNSFVMFAIIYWTVIVLAVIAIFRDIKGS